MIRIIGASEQAVCVHESKHLLIPECGIPRGVLAKGETPRGIPLALYEKRCIGDKAHRLTDPFIAFSPAPTAEL